MLTPGDDYPLHQTPDPIAFSGTDRNFYDRYFFNGYNRSGTVFFAAALGVYPQLNLMDAAFCLLADGVQHNLRAAKEMDMDRLNMQVGPIQVQILKPLQRIAVSIADNPHGLAASLECTARHRAVQEPRFTRRHGARAFMDYTRLTQNITWTGRITHQGRTWDADGFCGTRDRSWGIRPVGRTDPQPPVPARPPQFYWLWAPMNFQRGGFFCHTSDDAAGAPDNRCAVVVSPDGETTRLDRVDMQASYAPGTRRLRALDVQAPGVRARLQAAGPVFYMQGLGYTHPQWGHGLPHGPLEVAFDTFTAADAEQQLAAGSLEYLHVQALATATLELHGDTGGTGGTSGTGGTGGTSGTGGTGGTSGTGGTGGMGVMEQLFIGPHAPSGFRDLLDPAPPCAPPP